MNNVVWDDCYSRLHIPSNTIWTLQFDVETIIDKGKASHEDIMWSHTTNSHFCFIQQDGIDRWQWKAWKRYDTNQIKEGASLSEEEAMQSALNAANS